MSKSCFKIFVLLLSLFVIFTNIRYSLSSFDFKTSNELANLSCCSQKNTESCCDFESKTCNISYETSCRCSENNQAIPFYFISLVVEQSKEYVPLAISVFSNSSNQSFYLTKFISHKIKQISPLKTGVRLSLLQTYRN